MAIQISIIGLGQMGGSMGLALARHSEKIKRLGHDKDIEIARAAQKAGAVDMIHFNLPASVEQADLVILSLPLDEVRETLDFIRADLKEGAVVLDISPARRQGERWAREALTAGRYYIGLFPAINSSHLLETGGGLDAARADLFAEATVMVCPPSGTPENAVRLATDFVRLLGATPIISDADEADGLLAGMYTLPKLLAVSLVTSTMDQPGWRDAQNMAGRSYAMPVASTFDREDADALRESALANRDNIVRVLDGYLASLQELRDQIANEDKQALDKTIRAAQTKSFTWLSGRHLEKYVPTDKGRKSGKENQTSSPSLGARVRQMFLGNWKLPGEGEKKR